MKATDFLSTRIYKIIFILIVVLISNHALSAEYHSYKMKGSNRYTLVINGDINNHEYHKFKKYISTTNLDISTVVLQSNGGYFEEALKISDFIHKKHWHTLVETYCNSSCVYLFLAGKQPTMRKIANINIHSPYTGTLGVNHKQDKKHSKFYIHLLTKLTNYIKNKKLAKLVLEKMYDTPSTSKFALNSINQKNNHWHVINHSLLFG
ncbi:hypothetical protein [Vibrio gallicus]|uniref:hypothetical protein n=1 Tax=Vibrio gallicus TaxID=190897 RepID=UPI0021C443A4|nr:hypothetical protein [Vibrio gallicus]